MPRYSRILNTKYPLRLYATNQPKRQSPLLTKEGVGGDAFQSRASIIDKNPGVDKDRKPNDT